MHSESVSKKPKTPQGNDYGDSMSRFFGKDVSSSEPVQNYDKAAIERRIGRKRKHYKKMS